MLARISPTEQVVDIFHRVSSYFFILSKVSCESSTVLSLNRKRWLMLATKLEDIERESKNPFGTAKKTEINFVTEQQHRVRNTPYIQ